MKMENVLVNAADGLWTFLCFTEAFPNVLLRADKQDKQHNLMVVSDLKPGLCMAIKIFSMYRLH
jgi:hypothetical protein